MGCRFCATGRQGLQESLPAAEILNQIVSLPERDRLTNLVFMGMGEPLDNADNVLQALEIITAEWGFGWSPTRITLSTAGVVPELRRFLDATKVHLAVSLHNPFHEERMQIMPVERAWPLPRWWRRCARTTSRTSGGSRSEYIVMSGLNDTPRHVRGLLRLLNGLRCRINLIRFHRIPDSPYFSPDDEAMLRFRDELTARGIRTTIRASRGEDIQAACGLLSTRALEGVIRRGTLSSFRPHPFPLTALPPPAAPAFPFGYALTFRPHTRRRVAPFFLPAAPLFLSTAHPAALLFRPHPFPLTVLPPPAASNPSCRSPAAGRALSSFRPRTKKTPAQGGVPGQTIVN